MQITKHLNKIAFFLLTLTVLQSCNTPSGPGIYKNDKISAGDKSRFHDLNDKLFTALKTNDEAQLEFITSQDFIATTNRKRVVELASNRFKEGSYTILDEYYIVNRYLHGDTIKAGLAGTANYDIYCPGGVKEMYIACFVPKNIANQYMITAVYCKYDYGWKLNQLDASLYAKNGKNAPQLYEAAKESYAKGFLVNALNTGASALNCSRPNSLWKYDTEAEMSKFYSGVLSEVSAKYRIPLPIKGAATHLEIIRIFNQTTPEGDFPMIYYLTNVKLKDTVAIKKENEAIRKVIGKTITGIDQENKYVFYSAFNEWPTGVKTVEHFDMKQKLK